MLSEVPIILKYLYRLKNIIYYNGFKCSPEIMTYISNLRIILPMFLEANRSRNAATNIFKSYYCTDMLKLL